MSQALTIAAIEKFIAQHGEFLISSEFAQQYYAHIANELGDTYTFADIADSSTLWDAVLECDGGSDLAQTEVSKLTKQAIELMIVPALSLDDVLAVVYDGQI